MSLSVLIVDDEPMTRDLLRLMLNRAGYTVFEAGDGMDALEKVKENRPDVMILDVMMPNMDGLAVCEILRREKETADLPIIMLSARVHDEAVSAGMRAGATKYLAKPISRQDLVRNVSEALLQTGVSSPDFTPA